MARYSLGKPICLADLPPRKLKGYLCGLKKNSLAAIEVLH